MELDFATQAAYVPHFGNGEVSLPIGLHEWSQYVNAHGFAKPSDVYNVSHDAGNATFYVDLIFGLVGDAIAHQMCSLGAYRCVMHPWY